MPKMQIPDKLERFLTTPKRFKVAFGGRGGAKSQTFAQIFLMLSQTQAAKTMCLRELQNSISDSVHSLLCDLIDTKGLRDFEITDNAIRHNGADVFKFKGLSRNPDAVKSAHGFKYAWVEEAQTISEKSLQLLTPTLREAGSELWFSLNPGSSADPMSKRFLQPFYSELLRDGFYEDDQHLIVWINYDSNPWFPKELEAERQWDYDHLPRAVYNHVWLGHYLDEVEDSIIPVEWFDAAIDAHIKLNFKPRGAKYVAHDPSDCGDDAKGLAYRHGSVFLDVAENLINDVNMGCDWATDYATAVGADYFIWDCDGLGVSLRRQVSDALHSGKVDYQEFKGSNSVDYPNKPYDPKAIGGRPKSNKETFKNKRSQYAWLVRDKFYNTFRAVTMGEYSDPDDLISLSSNIKNMDKLRSEVCRVPLHQNNNGYIQLMSKKDMLRIHKIKSYNQFDSIFMSYAAKTHAAQRKTINIPSIKSRRLSR